MTRGLPRPDGSWTRSGWEVESAHVPGSFRMLGLWAAALVAGPVTVYWLQCSLGLHVAMVVGLLVSLTGLAAGVAVYAYASRTFSLPGTGPWEVPAPAAANVAVMAVESAGVSRDESEVRSLRVGGAW